MEIDINFLNKLLEKRSSLEDKAETFLRFVNVSQCTLEARQDLLDELDENLILAIGDLIASKQPEGGKMWFPGVKVRVFRCRVQDW